MSSLTFRYEPDHDHEGRLWLLLQTERFSGSGFFWSHRADVLPFAERLSAYPLPASEPPYYRAGYNDAEGEDAVLVVSVRPVGLAGDLLVEARISDLYEPTQRVVANFNTTYMEVAAFREQLNSLANAGADEAVLVGR